MFLPWCGSGLGTDRAGDWSVVFIGGGSEAGRGKEEEEEEEAEQGGGGDQGKVRYELAVAARQLPCVSEAILRVAHPVSACVGFRHRTTQVKSVNQSNPPQVNCGAAVLNKTRQQLHQASPLAQISIFSAGVYRKTCQKKKKKNYKRGS